MIPKITKVFSEFLKTENYVILEKNGCTYQQVPHIHFHFFPVHSEAWSDIFNIVPDRLSEETLRKQVTLFQKYFNEA